MKAIISILAISALFISSCSPLKIQSNQVKHSLIIDGKSEDWADIAIFYNDKKPFMIGAVNDSNQITLALVFRDPIWAQLLLRRGFSICLDEDKNNIIDYMGAPKPAINIKQNNQVPTPQFNNKNKLRSLTSRDFIAITQHPESYASLQEIENLDAAFSFDNGNYCLELQIPFLKAGKSFGIPVLSGNKVEIELLTKEVKQRQPKSFDGPEQTGSRGRGGRRGGGHGNRKGGMPSSRKEGIDLKVVIQLVP